MEADSGWFTDDADYGVYQWSRRNEPDGSAILVRCGRSVELSLRLEVSVGDIRNDAGHDRCERDGLLESSVFERLLRYVLCIHCFWGYRRAFRMFFTEW